MKQTLKYFSLFLITGLLGSCGNGGKSSGNSPKAVAVPEYAQAEIVDDNGYKFERYRCFFKQNAGNETVFTAGGSDFTLTGNGFHRNNFDNRGQAYNSFLATFIASGDDDEPDYRFRLVYSGTLYGFDRFYEYTFHFKVIDPKSEQVLSFLQNDPVKIFCNSWLRVESEKLQEASQWLSALQKEAAEKSLFAGKTRQGEQDFYSVRSTIGKSVVWQGFIEGQPRDFRSLYLVCGTVVNVVSGSKTAEMDGKAARTHNIFDDNIFTGKTFDGLFDVENFVVSENFVIE